MLEISISAAISHAVPKFNSAKVHQRINKRMRIPHLALPVEPGAMPSA